MGSTRINSKRIIAFFAILIILGTFLVSCGGSKKTHGKEAATKEPTEEEWVRSAVEERSYIAFFGKAIGGNELKSSGAQITNIKKISVREYKVSGTMVMTDIYGKNWRNNFDCSVTRKEKAEAGENPWVANSFEYKSDNWS